MKLNKIVPSTEASDRLKQLKAKTGLTPTLSADWLLPIALEPGIPDVALYPEIYFEFNRYTLLGEWDDLYVALLRQRLVQDGLQQSRSRISSVHTCTVV